MPASFLNDVIFVITAAFIGGFIARTIKLPPVLGYIASGLFFGFLGKNFFHSYSSLVEFSQIGISLLLFTLGFEISLDSIRRLKDRILLVGIIQILLTAGTIFPMLILFQFPIQISILYSFIFSFSSTAVVVKLLEEKGLLKNFPGDNVFLILLIQDLLVIPSIFFLPILFSQNRITSDLLLGFFVLALKPIAIFILILILGKIFLTKVVNLLFKYPSHELTVLATIFMASISIGIFSSVGLPQSVAAFLAGVIIAEQGKNLTLLTEIRPLRDVFLVLFFVTTGMLVNVNFLISNLFFIIILSILIILIKFLVFYIVLRFSRYSPSSSIFISSYLSNIGEFALIIGQIAFFEKYISSDSYNTILSVFIFSLILIPFWVKYFRKAGESLARLGLLKSFTGRSSFFFKGFDDDVLKDHVIICGHGRVGQEVRKILDISNIPYIVIDFNRKVISDLSKTHRFVIYGDPSDSEILSSAFIESAKALVIAVPDSFSQKRIINQAISLNSKISILCRSHVEDDKYELVNLGVKSIVMPELEAGLRMGQEILELFEVPDNEARISLRKVRRSHLP